MPDPDGPRRGTRGKHPESHPLQLRGRRSLRTWAEGMTGRRLRHVPPCPPASGSGGGCSPWSRDSATANSSSDCSSRSASRSSTCERSWGLRADQPGKAALAAATAAATCRTHGDSPQMRDESRGPRPYVSDVSAQFQTLTAPRAESPQSGVYVMGEAGVPQKQTEMHPFHEGVQNVQFIRKKPCELIGYTFSIIVKYRIFLNIL